MSVPKHVEEAALALASFWPITRSSLTESLERKQITAAAEALDRAGLLRTGLEKRAIEACEERAKHPSIWLADDAGDAEHEIASRRCITVGRESLAAKKPKERWTAGTASTFNGWKVSADDYMTIGSSTALTEPQARAIAKALNDLTEGM